MKKTLFLFILLSFLYNKQYVAGQTLPDSYSIRYYDTLRYGLFIPESYDPGEKYPLITYLHGYNDTVSKYLNWYRESEQEANPCFVITPRCAAGAGSWGNTQEAGLSPHIQLTLELIDSIISEFSIDTNRLYIYGTSMGGLGTFNVLYRQPGRFAAAMVLCGGADAEAWQEISQTPLWIFHGTEDESVPYELSRALYDTMIAHGVQKVRYNSYPGVGHNMWDYAPQERSWKDWMFNFSRTDVFNESPDASVQISCSVRDDKESLKVIWNNIDDREDRKNKIWYYKVFRDGELVNIQDYSDTTYVDQPSFDEIHTYQVTAVNYDFFESDTSNAYDIELPDLVNTKEFIHYNVTISPNPASNHLIISSEYPLERIQIIDLYGRVVKDIHAEQKNEIEIVLEGVESGMHIVRVYSNENVLTRCILIRNGE